MYRSRCTHSSRRYSTVFPEVPSLKLHWLYKEATEGELTGWLVDYTVAMWTGEVLRDALSAAIAKRSAGDDVAGTLQASQNVTCERGVPYVTF